MPSYNDFAIMPHINIIENICVSPKKHYILGPPHPLVLFHNIIVAFLRHLLYIAQLPNNSDLRNTTIILSNI